MEWRANLALNKLAVVSTLLVCGCTATFPDRVTMSLPLQERGVPLLVGRPPAYPTDRVPANAVGHVGFECQITRLGVPKNCATVFVHGPQVFEAVARSWLASPDARFEPVPSLAYSIYLDFTPAKDRVPPITLFRDQFAAPIFPQEYADLRQDGHVVARFAVAGGLPKDVDLRVVQGGDLFGHAVVVWLTSGHVRYRPAELRHVLFETNFIAPR